MASRSLGLSPRDFKRRFISDAESPASNKMPVVPSEMKMALPRLPLPREAKRTGRGLADLFVQQGQDTGGGGRGVTFARGIQHQHPGLPALGLQADLVLGALIRRG